ncbi:MAG: VWA domain-containing protein [Candidatus Gastranaerophilales bacterium]|nr:VWA domain-containing protein [Candidatus Gastranaerophilales bacterium]
MNNLKIILLISFFISFVNYTITGVVFAKSNFEYSVYTPESFQKLQSDTPRFSDGSNILFIVDYSNSMNEKMGGKTKMQVALDTLTVILPKIPPSVKTGLRVYGHKVGFTYLQGCMASKMAVPFAEKNADNILGALYNTKAVGWTPITYSLKQAVNIDFAGVKGKKHIVLLTDGGENCDESPCDYAIELMKTRDDIAIDVIAFDIFDEEANNQLRCAAVATRGKFYSANTPNQLLDSLFESLNIDKNVKGTIKVDEN